MSPAAEVIPLPRRRGRTFPKRKPAPSGPVELLEPKRAGHWRFQWHEEVLKRHDLPRSAIAVAGVLMHEYRIERGFAEISMRQLAARAGCCKAMAESAVRRLRRAGLIDPTNEGEKIKGKNTLATHRYRLIYISRGVL